MSKFGWSYPPGAASDPFAPYNQDDPPCQICGNEIDDCVCPECPVCHCQGDPECYALTPEGHGLRYTLAQLDARDAAEKRQRELAEADKAEAEYLANPPSEEV